MRLIVENVWTYIDGGYPFSIIDKATSYLAHGRWFVHSYKTGQWDGRKRFREFDRKRKMHKFPTGLLTRVTTELDGVGYPYELIDERDFHFVDPVLELANGDGAPIRLDAGKYDYQADVVQDCLMHGRGTIVVATGGGKCLDPNTEVLMHDGSVKTAADVVVGDSLMGPDSAPRTVLSVCSGSDEMFLIEPKRGEPWACNSVHVLTLVDTVSGCIVDIPLNEYLDQTRTFKHRHKLFATGVEFNERPAPAVDPYFLGLWMGDGRKDLSQGVQLTFEDAELQEFLRRFAPTVGCTVSRYSCAGRCDTFGIVSRGGANRLLQSMRKILRRVDHGYLIPESIKFGSAEVRLAFLAGVVDSDGYLHRTSYDVVQRSKAFSDELTFLARSLGFRVVRSTKTVPGYDYAFHRMSISGDTTRVPCLLKRKRAPERKQKKNPLRFGFKVTPLGRGPYAGFTLSGDGRFVLGNFQVTHNTEIAAALLASYNLPAVFLTHRKTLLHQTRDRLALRLKKEIGIIGDGMVEPKQITVAMVQTCAQRKSKVIDRTLKQARVLIGDEVHHLESKSWVSVFKKVGAPHRFGLTATPCFDGAGMNLIAWTGGVIAEAKAGDLIERGVLVRPNIWFVRVDDDQLPQGTPYATAYARRVVRSERRNARLVHVASVLKAEGKNCITLVRHLNHGDLVADLLCQRGIHTAFIHGKHSKSERETILHRLWTGDLDHVVAQAEILGEGVDLPMLQCVINATGTRGGGSKASGVEHEVGRGTIQFLGRLLRSAPGKTSADYVDFVDTGHKSLTEASRERVRTLEEEGYGPWIKYWAERVPTVPGAQVPTESGQAP